MKKLIILSIFAFSTFLVSAHPWKPAHYVIIDSDAGTDDMKAISLLLASPDVRVLAIIASPGVMSGEQAWKKIRSLLDAYHHEGIPVAISHLPGYKSPELSVAVRYPWGNETDIELQSAPDFIDVISNIIQHEKNKITFISLGGLSSFSKILRSGEEIRNQFSELIWSCEGLTDKKGFNYSIDKTSSDAVLKDKIPVYAVRKTDNFTFYDSEFISKCDGIKNRYSASISGFQSYETGRGHPFSEQLNDEHVSLFLQFPDLYSKEKKGNHFECFSTKYNMLHDAYLKMLAGETVKKNQVIRIMPADSSFYDLDISPFVNDIIQRYGIEEWTAGVLANELHRHLGVFAIIGVKMGIRAREYYNTGVDEFSVRSYAGSVPPLSCMNDGIQVSTGATPGHGLLTVRNDTITMPSAEFSYLGQRIRLKLKPHIVEKVAAELKEINFVYGLDSNIYWELVRKNAVRYWKILDRHEIFNIEVLK